MNNPNFPILVKRHFDFLLTKYGFSIASETYTDFPLAEWIVTLCSNELCVQVSIDKSQVFIDIGLPGKEAKWFDLMYIMMYLTKNSTWKYLWLSGEINDEHYNRQLAYLSGIFKEHYEYLKKKVTNIVNEKGERTSFEKFIKEYSK